MQKLSKLFNIHPGEGALVLLVLGYAILLYISNVFTRTASYALFLSQFDANKLPYAYIGISVAGPLVSALYLKLNERVPLSRALLGAHAFLLLTLGMYRLGLGVASRPWMLFSLPIYFGAINALTISSFWNLLGRLYNLQQGKRLFGLLSSGEHIATIIAGFLAPVVVSAVGTNNLFLGAAVFMGAALALLAYILRANAGSMVAEGEGEAKSGLLDDGRSYSTYLRSIATLFTLFILGIYVVDNVFYGQAQLQYRTENALASFIGIFFGTAGVLSLLVQAFVAGRVLNRFGLRAIILATPTGLIITTIPFAALGLAGGFPLALFWLAASSNMYRIVLDAVDSAAVNLLYQPLPAAQRTRAQTVVQGIIYPVAIGLAGVFLLILVEVLGLEPVQLSFVLLLILFIWWMVGRSLGHQYVAQLSQALRKRSLGDTTMFLPDRSSLSAIQEALTSDRLGTVIYALNTLEQIAPENMASSLTGLLHHASDEVKVEALRRLEGLPGSGTSDAVRARLRSATSLDVTAAAIRALAAANAPGALQEIQPFLEDSRPAIRVAALASLFRIDPDGAGRSLMDRLAQMAAHPSVDERLLAAQVAGEVDSASLSSLLELLLKDREVRVRRAALSALGKASYRQLWPHLFPAAATRETRPAALAALEEAGDAAVPLIGEALATPGTDPEVLKQLVRACGRIGGAEATGLLVNHLEYAHPAVRAEVWATLSRLGYQVRDSVDAYVQEQIREQAKGATAVAAALSDLGEGQESALLTGQLEEIHGEFMENIFYLLSLTAESGSILAAWNSLMPGSTQSSARRSYALETIDVLVNRELKPLVLSLLEVEPGERVRRLGAYFPVEKLGRVQRLIRLLEAPPGDMAKPWLTSVVVYTLGLVAGTDELATRAILNTWRQQPADEIVAESSILALAEQDPETFGRIAGEKAESGPPREIERVQRWRSARQRGDAPLTTVERVMILKKVGVFRGVPQEALADMSRLIEPITFPAGSLVIEKDAPGDSLYVIAAGKLRVHDGDRLLNQLTQGDAFGEMSLLDGKPRTASVTTETPAHLLRIERQAFFDFVAQRGDVLRSIMVMLSRQLRARVADLTAASVGAGESAELLEQVEAKNGMSLGITVHGNLLPVERFLILKSVDLFSQLDNGTLSAVARVLGEKPLGAGETLFTKGDPGRSMYIIASGRVLVKDGEQILDRLVSGEALGEMALIEAETRLATCVAEVPSLLLRLDQGAFYELVEEHAPFALGIIQVLSNRLRQRLRDLAEIASE